MQLRAFESLEASPLPCSPVRKNTEVSKTDISISCYNIDESPLHTSVDYLAIPNRKSNSKEGTQEKTNDSDNEILAELKQENKKYKSQLRETREKLLRSEEKSHEYLELYHKQLYEQKKSDQERMNIVKENIHIKNQLSILRVYVSKLENKLLSKSESNSNICEFEVKEEVWGKNYIVMITKILTEDSDEEFTNEVSEKFINLPIGKEKIQEMGDYLSFLRANLLKNSEIDGANIIYNLRNQVLQYFLIRAELINNDLVLAYNSLKCKNALLKEKFKVKSQSNKLQNERIVLLENTIEYLHDSYTKIMKHSRLLENEHWQQEVNPIKIVRPIERRNTHFLSNLVVKSLSFMGEGKNVRNEEHNKFTIAEAEAQVFLLKNYNKELKIGVDSFKKEAISYKDVLGKITDQLKINHDTHQRKMKAILLEYKNNFQDELKRRQEEINKLNEVLGHWMHQCMELQEKVGIPTSEGNKMHRRSLSKKYRDMIVELCEKTQSAVGKNKKDLRGSSIGRLTGDKSPPMYEE